MHVTDWVITWIFKLAFDYRSFKGLGVISEGMVWIKFDFIIFWSKKHTYKHN